MKKTQLAIIMISFLCGIGFGNLIKDSFKHADLNADQCRMIDRHEIQGSRPAVEAKEPVYYNTIFISEKNYKQFHGDSIEDEFFRPIFGNSPYPLIKDSIK